MSDFKGCLVALVTPFRNGAIDYRALNDLVDRLLAGGVDGLVPCGTTGESPTLSADEQREVIAAVVARAKGKVPVLAGTGTNATDSTIKRSKAAIEAGADGVMLVAPYYNRPNQRGLYEHFSAAARSITRPIVLYNIPGRTAVEIAVETVARLHADHPNIVAVKHATGSTETAAALAAVSAIEILSGDDTMTLPYMSQGAVGVVSVIANLLPKRTTAMVHAALAGDWAKAREIDRALFPLTRDLMRLDVNPIPIKTALAIKGWMAEEFRLPLCPMDPPARAKLEAMLHAAPQD